jgi:hypothetical protein
MSQLSWQELSRTVLMQRWYKLRMPPKHAHITHTFVIWCIQPKSPHELPNVVCMNSWVQNKVFQINKGYNSFKSPSFIKILHLKVPILSQTQCAMHLQVSTNKIFRLINWLLQECCNNFKSRMIKSHIQKLQTLSQTPCAIHLHRSIGKDTWLTNWLL